MQEDKIINSFTFTQYVFNNFAYIYGDKWLNRFNSEKFKHLEMSECFLKWYKEIKTHIDVYGMPVICLIDNYLNFYYPNFPPTLQQFLKIIENSICKEED